MKQRRLPINTELPNIVHSVLINPINKEKLIKKLETDLKPENLRYLKVKKDNFEM